MELNLGTSFDDYKQILDKSKIITESFSDFLQI